jgi:2-hydroxymuconate-semialdehyde hydrolase
MLAEFDANFEGLRIHGWEGGRGFPLLLIHGSGPGASTLGNWRLVLEPLAAQYHVIAADLVGFGLSDRKRTPPFFDVELWLRQAQCLLDRFDAEQVGVLGHSLSGALALKLAARDRRVAKVMTTGTMGAGFTPNEYLARVWTFPRSRAELRLVAECLVHDPSTITDAYIENRLPVLNAPGYAEYFGAMFAGDKQSFVDATVLSPAELRAITCEVTLLHGRDDLPLPVQLTMAIAAELPQADVVLLGGCGHSPALEHPQKLIAAAAVLFGADT